LDPAEYDYMFRLEDNLWWYVGMRRIVETLLRRRLGAHTGGLMVLDAGCGTGGSLKQLRGFGEVIAFDFYPQAAALSATRDGGRVLVASIDAIPARDASFDLVTAFDVVCQLPARQEEAALAEIARVLKPGGTALVRVPAYQALYGPHDATLQTAHRYTAPEVARKLAKAGLRDVSTTYANTLLFPLAAARRILAKLISEDSRQSDVRPLPRPLNSAFLAILTLEARLLRYARLPFGLSVIALATKP
jgi:ubiquinone/menaquinone biosynthesis C-methylase UbiE